MAFIESGKSFDKEQNYKKMKKRMVNLDTVQYPLRIPAPLYKKVKMKLVKDDTKLVTVLINMLERYIKE